MVNMDATCLWSTAHHHHHHGSIVSYHRVGLFGAQHNRWVTDQLNLNSMCALFALVIITSYPLPRCFFFFFYIAEI